MYTAEMKRRAHIWRGTEMTPQMRPDPGRAWDALSKYRGHQELLGGQGFLQLACRQTCLDRGRVYRAPRTFHRPRPSTTELALSPMKFPSLTATRESGMGPSGLQRYKQALTTGMGTGVWGGSGPKSCGRKRPSQPPVWTCWTPASSSSPGAEAPGTHV